MTTPDYPGTPLDRAATQFGLSADTAPLLWLALVVAGVLILVFPALVAWILGVSLIAAGVLQLAVWLVDRRKP